MIHANMPADEYHGLPRFSASMAWDIVGPDGCLALAWHKCPWLNGAYEPVPDEVMENGTMIHLAALEQRLLDERVSIIDASDYRTQAARNLRDDARANGLIPILYDRGPGSAGASFVKLLAIRKALERSDAAPLLFGDDGENEISYTWEVEIGERVPCKGRADRVIPGSLIDLKSAPTASPEGFQRSMATYGHHLRAAFYLDGWMQQTVPEAVGHSWDYVFVVVQKEPPHLVSVYQISERAIEWGHKLASRALNLYAKAIKEKEWPAFKMATLDLPVWAEHRLADQETAGEL